VVITRDKTGLGGNYESPEVWVVIMRDKTGLGSNYESQVRFGW
jgi:hypothetical protein